MKNCIIIPALAVLGCSAVVAKERQPNIIIILTDDQGSADLSCFGSTRIKSPNIDNMAAEGMILNRFYTASSVSSPSRAGLLTGRMPQRVGVPAVLFPYTTSGLPDEELTIAEMLRKEGYATSIIGKWHLGHKVDQLPLSQGFDTYYGVPYSNDMTIAKELALSPDILYNDGYTRAMLDADVERYPDRKEYVQLKGKIPLMRDNEVIEYPATQTTLTERYTEEAVKYIKKNRKKPFFLYMAHAFPHNPIYVGERFEGHSGNGIYCDAIEEIDWSVGELTKALEECGIADDTFIVYLSDNGPASQFDGSAGDLRGFKFDTYEGGFRSPCIMRYPRAIEAGRYSEEIVSALDIFPTIMSLVGVKMPTDRGYDGYDLSPYLRREQSQSPRNEIYYYHANLMEIDGVRIGDWKYLNYGNLPDYRAKKVEGGYLYNVESDISESEDMKAKYPQKYQELQYHMTRFDEELKESVK